MLEGTASAAPATAACLPGTIAVRLTLAAAMAKAAAALVGGLAIGELGFLPFRRLALGPGEGGANQPAVSQPVVLLAIAGVVAISVARLRRILDHDAHADALESGQHGGFLLGRRVRHDAPARRLRRRGILALAARGPTLFVLVIGLAGRAPGVGYLVVNHRGNRMVGHTSFPRTVVVHGVTEPKPALLHALPQESGLPYGQM